MDFKKFFEKNKVKLSDRDYVATRLGGLITAARLYADMTQAELAGEIGTQQPSLARAEKGEVVPSVEFLYKIAKAIKTEFIFPKFGFMEKREQTSYIYRSINSDDSGMSSSETLSSINFAGTTRMGALVPGKQSTPAIREQLELSTV